MALSEAIDYIVRRGLNDAQDLPDPAASVPLRKRWKKIAADIKNGDYSQMEPFCAEADRIAAETQTGPRFFSPEHLIRRTRTAIAAVKAITALHAEGKKPDLNAVAARSGAKNAGEIEDACGELFVASGLIYPRLLGLCGVQTKSALSASIEVSDKYDIAGILEKSMQSGEIPADSDSQKETIKKMLIDELHSVVNRFIKAGSNVNDVVLNRYSYYYREYGVRLYYLWFGSDLHKLCEHKNGAVKSALQGIFHGGGHQNRIELNELRWSPPLKEDLSANPDAVERHFHIKFGAKFRAGFNPAGARMILDFWREQGFAFAPRQSWFMISDPEVLKERFENMRQLAAECEKYAVPFKTRVQILQANMPVKDLLARITFFENHGIPTEYCGSYLIDAYRHLPVSVQKIISVVCAERRFFGAAALKKDAQRIPEALPAQLWRVSHARVAALQYLARVGYPYDDFRTLEHSPEAYADRVKLFVDAGLPVTDLGVGGRPIEEIQDEIAFRLRTGLKKRVPEEYPEKEYDAFIAARGLNPPDWLFFYGKSPSGMARIIDRIRYIERRGVPFTPADTSGSLDRPSWSWINLGPAELDRKVERAWLSLHNAKRRKALCYAYGVDVNSLPPSVSKKATDHLWEYLRVLRAAELTPADFYPSLINQLGINRWREFLFDKVKDKPAGEGSRKLFVDKFRFAEEKAFLLGWEDGYELVEPLTSEEFYEMSADIEKGKNTYEWHQRLKQRVEQFRTIKARLLRARASYADIDYFLEFVPLDEMAERIAVFDDAGEFIDVNLLYKPAHEIRNAMEAPQEMSC